MYVSLETHKKQTMENISLLMVETDGLNIKWVDVQTPEIALAAVKQNGMALYDVLEQTPDIALAAVKQNGLALPYVAERPLCFSVGSPSALQISSFTSSNKQKEYEKVRPS